MSNTTILKFTLKDFDNIINDYDIVKFLNIQIQNDIVCVWAVCNIGIDRIRNKKYNIFKVGTGPSWSLEHWNDENYIGTIQENGYVWHYFWEEIEDLI